MGYTTKNAGSVPDNFKNYFVLYFSKPFSGVSVFSGDSLQRNIAEVQSEHAGAVVGFKTRKDEKNIRSHRLVFYKF
ncbi:MAG: hypothetical protein WDO19_24700 [Bacteroidota bacterium]